MELYHLLLSNKKSLASQLWPFDLISLHIAYTMNRLLYNGHCLDAAFSCLTAFPTHRSPCQWLQSSTPHSLVAPALEACHFEGLT